jgi:SAM-dependent methyltransferase
MGSLSNMEIAVESTLAKGARTRIIKTLSASKIIEGYRTHFGIDVSSYFDSDLVPIYECEETTYKFFHPSSLMGREQLYQGLQKEAFFYKHDKWEYRRALSYLSHRSYILDVGCGIGSLLRIAAVQDHSARGLEFNLSAVNAALDYGLDVRSEAIADHAKQHPELYDAVCSFQVLEHIYDVRSFIEDCIRVLKPGGFLIFGVPNNDAFIRFDDTAILNCPPHHMGLWSPRSLRMLPRLFPLDLVSIDTEPLAEIDWYCSVMERRWMPNSEIIETIYYKLKLSTAFKSLVRRNTARIAGHTVLGIFQKKPKSQGNLACTRFG